MRRADLLLSLHLDAAAFNRFIFVFSEPVAAHSDLGRGYHSGSIASGGACLGGTKARVCWDWGLCYSWLRGQDLNL